MQGNFAIIVFSHLRWDFVYQRPQHLLSRLARRHRVVFIEEPVSDGDAGMELLRPESNVLICRPHLAGAVGFADEHASRLRPVIRRTLLDERLEHYVAWMYTPMALPLLDDLRPMAVVYDAMDELSAFLGAPPQLLQREAQLLKMADVVFTGGPSLYRAKRDRHPNVLCFPSSVDRKHFAAAAGARPAPGNGAPPRLGFFGVIDERADLPLLSAVAALHPEWQIEMVGPVVKINQSSLPRNSNIHYFGQHPYGQLPGFVKNWDVCLLPFARNQATRFISPTKTLEYMAAEKMIVSTPITDVAEPYGDIVYLGETTGEFAAACEQALAATPEERERRVARMREVLSTTSWDSTVAAMEAHIVKAIESRPAQVEGAPALASATSGGGARAIVVGAGPTGLSAAYHLGEESLLLEQNSSVGGWCRSLVSDGFTFDFAGHIMFSNEPYVHQLYTMLLGDNVHWQDREAWIYSHGVYTRYPFQGALYGLPPKVIKECIMGAIEARFGPSKQPKPAHNGKGNGNGNGNGKALLCKPAQVTDCCADGILESTAALAAAARPGDRRNGEPRNFEEFIYKVWGAGIAKHFAIPYNRKLWAVPLTEMETSWLGGRVPLPDLEEMIEGALSPVARPMGPNARFGYPLRGGFQALMDGWLPYLRDRLRLNCRVAAVSPGRHTVTLADGTELRYEHLVSTMPLPVLVRMLGAEAPAEVRAAAAALRHVSVRCVHIGVGRENLTEKHWIYFPEDAVFHRIFVQGNASPYCNPPGGFGLTCEITYSPHKPLPAEGDELVRMCVEDCRKVGIVGPDDPILTSAQCDLPYAYVVYDHGRAQSVAQVREWLAKNDILLAGRYSEWEYYNSDHAFIAGKKAAEEVKRQQGQAVVAGLVANSWQSQREEAQGD